MTVKYERICWSCGSNHLELDSRGVKCLDCGATWNYVPVLRDGVIENYGSILAALKEHREPPIARPSKSVSRAAAKARAQN